MPEALIVVLVAGAVLALAYGLRRERRPRREPEAPEGGWPLDDRLAVTRAVRQSYDGLPYRRRRSLPRTERR